MRYILMMHAPRGTGGDYQINNWSPEDFKAHIAFMNDFNKELTESGEYVSAAGLTPPNQAKLVRAGKNGKPITDGVFPESKEYLAGYWIVDAESAERAYEIAGKASTAPGPGGVPLNMAIEVRPVLFQAPKVE
jgi:hypothetical protein